MIASAIAIGDYPTLARLSLFALFACVLVQVPDRLRNARGAWLLIGIPWLALITAMALRSVGRFTLFTIGDDALTYQEFAHRIYFERYWLEGGQTDILEPAALSLDLRRAARRVRRSRAPAR